MTRATAIHRTQRWTYRLGELLRSRHVRGAVRGALVAWFILLAMHAGHLRGNQLSKEYQVKLAYLFNFMPYVEWPDGTFGDDPSPLIVGVFGNDPFGPVLERAGEIKSPKGRSVQVLRFANLSQYRPCHVLFIPRTVPADLRNEILRRTAKSPTLVITENPGSAVAGSTVNFFLDVDGTVGFEINIDAARAHNLKISAKLLKLAKVVRAPSKS